MARIQFGPLLPSQRESANAFLDACRQAGIQAEIPADIVKANWEKFVFLVGLSSTTAVARAPVGVVRSDPDLRWLFVQCMRETWTLGRKRGVALADDYIESRIAFADTLHADMKASLLHDLEAGGKLEAPWLCGAVARMSAEVGLDAPANRAVYAALKPYVNGSQSKAA
jgi:2-dehydropantoate 2-reductase